MADAWAVPASFAQERVWFASQVEPDSPVYNLVVLVALPFPLAEADVVAALGEVVARHEPLRTSFRLDDDGLRQVIHPRVPVEVDHLDLSGLDGAEQGRRRDAARIVDAGRPIPLDRPPLWRARLIRLGEAGWELLFIVHHTVFDGGSVRIFQSELTELCRATAQGHAPRLPKLAIEYADHAVWQRDTFAGAADEALAYWRARLAGVPLAHSLPTDRPRPAAPSYAGDEVRFVPADGVARGIDAVAAATGATPFMVVLAAYAALVSRLSGQPDVVVAVPVAGRDLPELAPLIGMFVNTLVLRVDTSGDPTFTELVRAVRDRVLDDFEHADVPFQTLVEELVPERDASIPPLVQLGLNYLPDIGIGSAYGTSKQELTLELSRREARLEYSRALFDEPTMRRLADRFALLLDAAVTEPVRRLSELPVLPDAERAELARYNATVAAFPDRATLSELIEAQVARTPDAVAVTFEEQHLTYRQLDARADAVAGLLRARGVGPEMLVAVCAHRSLELVVGLLGVLKAGAAYVPLDPDYPAERLRFMLDDAGPPVLLAQRDLLDRLPATAAEVITLDSPYVRADPGTRPACGPGNVAYVIYTSGSTGRPKGVPNTQQGVVNRLDWMQRTYRLGSDDAVLQKTPAGFDVSVWEFFWPLLAGARLVLARPGGHKDPAYLRDLIVAERITTVHFVPSMLAAFVAEDGIAACQSLRRVISSGEELPVATATRLLAALPGCVLDNLYGPTEAAIDVSVWRCEPVALAGAASVPIGTPIQNIRLHVLDPAGEPAPIGVPGELYIAGVGVARGYLNRPGLTADRFRPDPFGPPGSRLYRTGDIARWTAAGVLEFLGRVDNQVKLRGQRIEPGEIEAAVRASGRVHDAAVVVREDAPGDKRLVAYVTPGPAGPPDLDLLRDRLRETVPDHLIPSAFEILDALPLTPNGKLDRAALPAPAKRRRGEPVAPRTEAECLIAREWGAVLGVPSVGVDDDFFDAGGHSMLAVRLVARLRAATEGSGRRIGVMDVFQCRTVRALAALIERPGDDGGGPPPLLYELTEPGRPRTRTYVCVPFGAGSAAVFQPLADALPDGNALYAVAVPGHDIGLDDGLLPLDELVRCCTEEILDRVTGPVVLYGHCAVGGLVAVELALALEARGRLVEAVYCGGVFPMAQADGPFAAALARFDRISSNRGFANWLTALGARLDELPSDQVDRIVGNMRAESEAVLRRFPDLLASPRRLHAPIISVVGERDPLTEYYLERYREWQVLTDSVAVVVVEEGGHYFVRYRPAEVAEIVTRVHPALAGDSTAALSVDAIEADAGWWLAAADRRREPAAAAAQRPGRVVRPSLRRFLGVAAGQFASMTGTAVMQWAVPVWIYLQTGSLTRFGLFAVVSLTPGLVLAPLIGALVDRLDRRLILIASGVAGGAGQLVLAVLYGTDQLRPWHLYTLLAFLSVALSFQRLAYTSAAAQLVPKRYLGHAAGVTQVGTGVAALFAPLLAAGVLATIGLGGILAIDIASYVLAVGVVAAVRFPDTMPRLRRDSLATEIIGGFRYSWWDRGLRAMLLFSALLNAFLAPLLVLLAPLVLSFGTVRQAGQVSFLDGLGAVLGGVAVAIWGGPQRLRMRGFLLLLLAEAGFLLLAGLHPWLWLVAIGTFAGSIAAGMSMAIYTTIVQVNVPQRYHGRVFAINQMIAWSTLPFGYGLIAPQAARLADPLLAPGGALASTVGTVIGVGPGRGIGLLYVVFALTMMLLLTWALRTPALARFDTEVSDVPPDDVIGVRILQQRRARAAHRRPAAASEPVLTAAGSVGQSEVLR